MFNSFSEKISGIVNNLKNKYAISEKDFDDFVVVLRRALLEADVSLLVVKEFISNIKESVVGQRAVKNFSRSDTIVKIVKDELVKLLGSENAEINLKSKKPISIMMVGLQGSGKTTTSAKLALLLRKECKQKVLLSSLDIYRPAAQKQLQMLASQIAVDSVPIADSQSCVDITRRSLDIGKDYDVIIFDTAGRLHVDEDLMGELKDIKDISNPAEILLVVDSMIGQESFNIAKRFHEDLDLSGLILSRIDGDARGGAALSMRRATGVPIKFLGAGENVSDFERFHPDRIASRILGMGDIASLVEQASSEIGDEKIDSLKDKIIKGKFDFNDLLFQFRAVSKLGGITKIMKLIPGINKMPIPDMINDKKVKSNIAAIHSMTKKERENPDIINQSRKIRIAKGASLKIGDINKLMKNFAQARSMAMKFGKMGMKGMNSSNITDIFKN